MKSKNFFKLFTATVIACAIAFSIPVSAQENTYGLYTILDASDTSIRFLAENVSGYGLFGNKLVYNQICFKINLFYFEIIF